MSTLLLFSYVLMALYGQPLKNKYVLCITFSLLILYIYYTISDNHIYFDLDLANSTNF